MHLYLFLHDAAPTNIYTLSLHDALPISNDNNNAQAAAVSGQFANPTPGTIVVHLNGRVNEMEEHTSELQSPVHLVCRLLLEKKKKQTIAVPYSNTQNYLYQSSAESLAIR